MANDKSNQEGHDCESDDMFDVNRVRQLVLLMKEHELTELDLRQGHQRIRIRSGQGATFVSAPAMHSPMAQPVAPSADTPGPAAVIEAETTTVIKSPMVGTFYTSAKPGDPPFVKIGDHVAADTVVCIVEAMKMFNEIPAGISGKIVGVIARNEEPVDVGRPLFRIVAD